MDAIGEIFDPETPQEEFFVHAQTESLHRASSILPTSFLRPSSVHKRHIETSLEASNKRRRVEKDKQNPSFDTLTSDEEQAHQVDGEEQGAPGRRISCQSPILGEGLSSPERTTTNGEHESGLVSKNSTDQREGDNAIARPANTVLNPQRQENEKTPEWASPRNVHSSAVTSTAKTYSRPINKLTTPRPNVFEFPEDTDDDIAQRSRIRRSKSSSTSGPASRKSIPTQYETSSTRSILKRKATSDQDHPEHTPALEGANSSSSEEQGDSIFVRSLTPQSSSKTRRFTTPRKSSKTLWTEEDDLIVVKKSIEGMRKKDIIARYFPERSLKALKHRLTLARRNPRFAKLLSAWKSLPDPSPRQEAYFRRAEGPSRSSLHDRLQSSQMGRPSTSSKPSPRTLAVVANKKGLGNPPSRLLAASKTPNQLPRVLPNSSCKDQIENSSGDETGMARGRPTIRSKHAQGDPEDILGEVRATLNGKSTTPQVTKSPVERRTEADDMDVDAAPVIHSPKARARNNGEERADGGEQGDDYTSRNADAQGSTSFANFANEETASEREDEPHAAVQPEEATTKSEAKIAVLEKDVAPKPSEPEAVGEDETESETDDPQEKTVKSHPAQETKSKLDREQEQDVSVADIPSSPPEIPPATPPSAKVKAEAADSPANEVATQSPAKTSLESSSDGEGDTSTSEELDSDVEMPDAVDREETGISSGASSNTSEHAASPVKNEEVSIEADDAAKNIDTVSRKTNGSTEPDDVPKPEVPSEQPAQEDQPPSNPSPVVAVPAITTPVKAQLTPQSTPGSLKGKLLARARNDSRLQELSSKEKSSLHPDNPAKVNGGKQAPTASQVQETSGNTPAKSGKQTRSKAKNSSQLPQPKTKAEKAQKKPSTSQNKPSTSAIVSPPNGVRTRRQKQTHEERIAEASQEQIRYEIESAQDSPEKQSSQPQGSLEKQSQTKIPETPAKAPTTSGQPRSSKILPNSFKGPSSQLTAKASSQTAEPQSSARPKSIAELRKLRDEKFSREFTALQTKKAAVQQEPDEPALSNPFANANKAPLSSFKPINRSKKFHWRSSDEDDDDTSSSSGESEENKPKAKKALKEKPQELAVESKRRFLSNLRRDFTLNSDREDEIEDSQKPQKENPKINGAKRAEKVTSSESSGSESDSSSVESSDEESDAKAGAKEDEKIKNDDSESDSEGEDESSSSEDEANVIREESEDSTEDEDDDKEDKEDKENAKAKPVNPNAVPTKNQSFASTVSRQRPTQRSQGTAAKSRFSFGFFT
jgi:hypothetical protein